MNARVLAIASLLPLAAVLVVSTAFAGSGERASIAQLRGVNFVSSCTFSHRAADDPIVFFGQARRVPRPLVRREHPDERVVDAGHRCSRAARPASDRETRPPTGCRRSTWTGSR